LWTGALLYVLVIVAIRRRLDFFKQLLPSLIFFVLYVIGAGSYEGNMGTAFRHKSLILWVIVFLVISAYSTSLNRNKRSNSQESAV
jgi:hypothetical protein